MRISAVKNIGNWFTTDRIIAAFTVVLAIEAGLQGWVMYSGGTDTHDLAVAAKKQSIAAKKLAEQASKQVVAMKTQNGELKKSLLATQALVRTEKSQAESTRKLTEASHQSASNASRALRLAQQSDRAWVSLALFPPKPIAGKRMSVKAILRNVGRSPAFIDKDDLAGSTAQFMSSNPTYVVKSTDSRSVLFPGESEEMPGKAKHFVTFRLYSQIIRGATTYYIWARVDYRTPGDPNEHSTHACVRWSAFQGQWLNCHTYNTAN